MFLEPEHQEKVHPRIPAEPVGECADGVEELRPCGVTADGVDGEPMGALKGKQARIRGGVYDLGRERQRMVDRGVVLGRVRRAYLYPYLVGPN
jgi:hypothetical protein